MHSIKVWLPAVIGLALVQSCKHEIDGTVIDALLLEAAMDTGAVYYVNTPTITAPAGNSPHGPFRVRFNAIAAAALDSVGKLPPAGSFPAGSVIVKDVYLNNTLDLYAVMKKAPTNPLAGAGWLWNEVRPDGTVLFSAARKGDGCIGCHSGGANRDLVRVFDLH